MAFVTLISLPLLTILVMSLLAVWASEIHPHAREVLGR